MTARLKLFTSTGFLLVAAAAGAAGIANAARAAMAAAGAGQTAMPDASRGADVAWAHHHSKAAAHARSENSAASAGGMASADSTTHSRRTSGSEASSSSSVEASGQGQGRLSNSRSLTEADNGGTAPQAHPELPESDPSWQARFAWGLYYSKLSVAAAEYAAGSWTYDRSSRSGIPVQMLRAEELLEASMDAPEAQRRPKVAERALRLYYHAKWLAERNHATAAEWRYREASTLARQSRRNVLAAHALGRLGYFLMHWRRPDEAREVLLESQRVSSKSNPLAPYLYGLLERQSAGSDAQRLVAAEEMIIHAGEQPSEDLEVERQMMVLEIDYWRKAELSAAGCPATADAAHIVICFLGHLFFPTAEQATIKEVAA
eukprot:CAMPEP_0115066846 /NCGR_PEP_ID=MMETSP0227-20121206/11047_1 /TAXON_ID=89957 /ORGANISM="Polarella glacialis, Strain CCMP 1383" /LENGTH=374 /DNA_ID=CAMNT_0002452819 /DNA_START=280 /DNA_END=1404 /DNA_ORIENTATION=+